MKRWVMVLQALLFDLPPGWNVELGPLSIDGEFEEWDLAMAVWLREQRASEKSVAVTP